METIIKDILKKSGEMESLKINWVTKNTAVLIIHGIGNQLPLETIDQFGIGLVNAYKLSSIDIELKHIVVQKPRSNGKDFWLDNVIRIYNKAQMDGPYIDLYEYYWANMTEDKADWKNISKWLNDVIANAKKFYKANETLGNVLGDIVLYNVINPRSSDYEIKKQILDGAVNAITYLFEKQINIHCAYPSIVIAGHSLGSQIAYDAVNRLTLFTNQELVKGYHEQFIGTQQYIPKIQNQFAGFITFGSPLDKTAFFFREQVSKKQFLKSGILNDYLCFRQKEWYGDIHVEKSIYPVFNQSPIWKNYYDTHDYVSGPLDFYIGVENINCSYTSNPFSFTHSRYWEDNNFFVDVIKSFLK